MRLQVVDGERVGPLVSYIERVTGGAQVGAVERPRAARLGEQRLDVLAGHAVDVDQLAGAAAPARPRHRQPPIAQAAQLDRPVELRQREAL